MIDDVSDIAAMYSSDLEREHLRLERHQLEHDITWRYLNKYLPPEGCILEIGVIISSFISRFGILGDLLKKMPEWIERQAEVRSVIDRGRDLEHLPRQGFRGYFANVSEIAPLHKKVGFEVLVVAGVEPAISADDESYNKLKGRQRKLWLDLLYEASTEATILGASRHLLYVGKKRKK